MITFKMGFPWKSMKPSKSATARGHVILYRNHDADTKSLCNALPTLRKLRFGKASYSYSIFI